MFKKRLRRTLENGYLQKDMCVPDHLDIEVLHLKEEDKRLYSLTCYNAKDQVILRLCMSRDCFEEVGDGIRACVSDMDIKDGIVSVASNTDDRMYN